jgi:hypothetical protein
MKMTRREIVMGIARAWEARRLRTPLFDGLRRAYVLPDGRVRIAGGDSSVDMSPLAMDQICKWWQGEAEPDAQR